MVEKQPVPSLENKPLYKYSTMDLGKLFLIENFQGNRILFEESCRRTGTNLKTILAVKFPGKTEYLESERVEIVKDMASGRLTFAYMAYMLQENHPMVQNWPEKDKRRVLKILLDGKIKHYREYIADIKSGNNHRLGDNTTVEELEKEMKPYQNFRKRLLVQKGLLDFVTAVWTPKK